MLKDWSVSNFKAIATTRVVNEDGNINDKMAFKPLTVFCGANSSGKSSLLQSLLLLAQTMRHQNKDIPLILNGAFTSLGTFDDVKTKPSDCDEVKIRFTYDPSDRIKFYCDEYPFNGSGFEPDDCESIENSSFSLDFGQGENEISSELSNFELTTNFFNYTLKYSKKGREDIRLDSYFYVTDIEYDNKEMEENRIPSGEECYAWNHFLPKNIIISGKHIITMNVLKYFSIFTFIRNGSDLNFPFSYPDEMTKWAENLGYDFYYASRITKGVFLYLRDDLLSGIQGIESLFDLKGFEFKHYTQGYPIEDLKWNNNFADLPVSVQDEVIDRIKSNLHIIYDKIFNELSNIEELMSHIEINDSQKQKNEKQDLYEDFEDAKLCCDCFFFYFKASKNIEKYFSEISDFFSINISYLGPLREDPKPLYPISESSYMFNVGKKGENTAAILALHGEDTREFPLPDWINSIKYGKEKTTLKKAVIEWLDYIEVVEDMNAEIKQGGFALKVKTPGSEIPNDLTNVGVGVSQIIPIVTMCLFAKEGSTLIIEQPELHLHPKMQTKLTDFFVAVSQSGKQCIIETHSDHIINALRYIVAKTQTPDDEKLANNVQIYFAEKDEKGTLFKAIGINKYAAMSDWPEGFFDESSKTADEIIKAVSKKWEENEDDKK